MSMMPAKQFKKIAMPSPVPVKMPAPRVTNDYEPLAPATVTPVVVSVAKKLPELTAKFLFAGRAKFIVRNPKGEKFIYRVRGKETEWPRGSGQKQTSYFISVKTEGGQYPHRFLGVLKSDGTIKVSAKSEFQVGQVEFDVAQWATRAVCQSKMIPDTYIIEHAGACGRCGRTLTDAESIKRGIGPDCWAMMGRP